MLKSDIDRSITTLIDTLKECNIEEMLQTLAAGEIQPSTVEVLKSYKKFIKAYAGYSEFEYQLLEISGLGDLKEESLWSRFVKPDESDTAEVIQELHASVQFLMKQLPKIQTLGSAVEGKISAVIEAGKNAGVEYVPLSVVVIEEEELSTPGRLSAMLDGIQGLYEVTGRLQNLPVQDLIVTSCDSGNDKLFNFLGASTIIEAVKDVILSFWDRVIFYREDKRGEYIKLLTETLPVMTVINKMEQDVNLEKEEAEILRRKVTASINRLIKAGITIPEMEEHAKQDPRELMRPDRKSLAQGVEPIRNEQVDQPEKGELTGEYPAVMEEEDVSSPQVFDGAELTPDTEPAAEMAEEPEEAVDQAESTATEPDLTESTEDEAVSLEKEKGLAGSFEDLDTFGIPKGSVSNEPKEAEPVEKDYSQLSEDIYTQAGEDDVEVILGDESLTDPPVESTDPETNPDMPMESADEEIGSEESEASAASVMPEPQEDEPSESKMDEEMENIFRRMAEGFLEKQKQEAAEKDETEETKDPDEDEMIE